jgi:hypothetical protein
MRILIINQFFRPDAAPTGQYACDLARHLNAEGHDITVVCSAGSYAEAEDSLEDAPPVKIIRVPAPHTNEDHFRDYSHTRHSSPALCGTYFGFPGRTC